MIERRRLTHVVVDTDVVSWLLDPRPSPHAESARRIVGGRARVVSFVTVTEPRFAPCGQAGVSYAGDTSSAHSPIST